MEEKNKKPVDPPEPENEFDNEPESDLEQESENETASDYESKQETENDAEYNDTVDEKVTEETEEDPEEPEHFFNNKPDSDNSSKSNFGQPASVDEEKKKHSIVFTTIFIILALSVAVIYYLISNGTDGLFSEKTTESSEIAEGSETNAEKPEKETEIPRDSETATALFGKLFALHIPTTQDDYKTYGNLDKNISFDFRGSYNVNEHLYPDASKFTESDKLYLVTRHLQTNGKTKLLSSFNVPNNFLQEVNDYCKNPPEGNEYLCVTDINTDTGLSKDDVEKEYTKLFGGKPTHQDPTPICGRFLYSSKYGVYYLEPVGGCGGVDLINHQLYVTKYSQKDNEAYVDIALNTINEDLSINGNITVYKKYLKLSDFYDYELQKDKEIDSSYIYKTASETETSKLFITEENYNEFDQFRFIFEKDTDNNYFFKGVEKL